MLYVGSKGGGLEHLVPKVAKLPYYEDTTKSVATLSVIGSKDRTRWGKVWSS